jgi:hypothetical protein
MYKLGTITNGKDVPFIYPGVWAIERTTGPDRMILAPERGHIDLMLECAASWSSTCSVLYVLLLSRLGNETGRYQCPEPLSRDELDRFVNIYRAFLEFDGRHHFWISSVTGIGTLVYDQHNVIYAYGALELYRPILERHGLREVPQVRFPKSHTHEYNEANDVWEERIMNHWNWRKSPLQKNDVLT